MQIGAATLSALSASPPLSVRFPNVTSITFGCAAYDNGALLEAFLNRDARHFTRLARLDMSLVAGRVLGGAVWPSFDTFAALLPQCSTLEALSLPDGVEAGAGALTALRQLPRLQSLSLRGFRSTEPIVEALTRLSQLTALTLFTFSGENSLYWILNELHGGPGHGEGNDAILLKALPGLGQLQRLHIQYDFRHAQSLEGNIDRLTQLTFLRFEQCALNDDDCRLLARLPSLKVLVCDVLNFDDIHVPRETQLTSVTRLGLSVARLTYISNLPRFFTWFPCIQACSVSLPSEHDLQLLSGMPRLKELDIDYYFDTGEGLLHLSHLSNLESLRMDCRECAPPVSEENLAAVMRSGGLRALRSLHLIGFDALTDASLAMLAAQPTLHFTELAFARCEGFTLSGLSAFVAAAPQLRRLLIGRASSGGMIDADGVQSCRRGARAAGRDLQVIHPWDCDADYR